MNGNTGRIEHRETPAGLARELGDCTTLEDGDVEARITAPQADTQSIFAELLDDTESALSQACWQGARGWMQVQTREELAAAS